MAEAPRILIVGGGIAGATLGNRFPPLWMTSRHGAMSAAGWWSTIHSTWRMGKDAEHARRHPVAIEGATIKALAQPF
jgi:hypothetical protein